MFDKKQDQNVGNGGVAVQAGGDADVSINKYVGLSEEEVKRIVKISIDAIQKNHNEQMDGLVEDKRYLESQLESAIRALTERTSDKDESVEFKEKTKKALDHIREGNTLDAENLFLKIENDEINKIKVSTNRAINAAMHRGALAYMRDTDSAIDAYKRVLQLDSNNIIAWGKLGYLYLRQGKLKLAENSHKRILALAKRDNDTLNIAAAYGALGQVYFNSGHYKQSMIMQRRALQIRKKLRDIEGIIGSYTELTNLMVYKGNFRSAKPLILRAITLSRENNHRLLIAHSSATAGIVYSSINEFDNAERYFNDALQIFTEEKLLDEVAKSYGNLGILYKNKGDLNKAKEMYDRSLEIERNLGNRRGIASDLLNLSNFHCIKKEYDLGIDKAEESLSICRDLKFKSGIAGAFSALGSSYLGKNVLDKSLEFFAASSKLEHEIGNKHNEAKQLLNLSHVHHLLSDIDNTKLYVESALNSARQTGDLKLVKYIENIKKEI